MKSRQYGRNMLFLAPVSESALTAAFSINIILFTWVFICVSFSLSDICSVFSRRSDVERRSAVPCSCLAFCIQRGFVAVSHRFIPCTSPWGICVVTSRDCLMTWIEKSSGGTGIWSLNIKAHTFSHNTFTTEFDSYCFYVTAKVVLWPNLQ